MKKSTKPVKKLFLGLICMVLLSVFALQAKALTEVSTVAGTGTAGFADGDNTTTRFNSPRGVVVDSQGNIFIADLNNNRIRKVDTNGVTSTFAGSGSTGFLDGVGTAARFNRPQGIAIDANDNIYVADTNNRRIRKISPDGTVTTLSGTGSSGSTDGAGNVARFNAPQDLAVNAAGEVFVADTNNHRIRKVLPDGTTSTLAGSSSGFADGPGASARFRNPRGITIASNGDIYIADSSNHRIRKIDSSNNVSTVAGTGLAGFADDIASAALFNNPFQLSFDSQGNLYIADTNNHRIRKIDTSDNVSTVAGVGNIGFNDGEATTAKFATPIGITVDASGSIIIGDTNNARVRKIAFLEDPPPPPPPPLPPENEAPSIKFLTELAEQSLEIGTDLNIRAFAFDLEDGGDISNLIEWESDLQGALNVGESFNVQDLIEGTHIITASITDSDGATSKLKIALNIFVRPEIFVEITSPSKDGKLSFRRRRRIIFEANAFEVINGEIVDISSQILWKSSVDGVIGSGGQIAIRKLSRGDHTITASIGDSEDSTGAATIISEDNLQIRIRRRKRR